MYYFIEESEHGSVLYQQLSWQAVEDIFGYKFEPEKEDDNNKWRRIDKKLVKDNFTDVSLPPGSYRYKITVINLLEQAEASSAYRNFEILIAHQSEVNFVSPQLIYLDEFFDGTFAASGAYFLRHTVFFLNKQGSVPIPLVPAELSKNGKKARFELNLNKFNPGVYTFTVRDISGLIDKSKTVTFKFQKPVDAYVSASYTFTGFAGESVFQTFYNRNIAPLGDIFRFSLLLMVSDHGNSGFSLGRRDCKGYDKLTKDQLFGTVTQIKLSADGFAKKLNEQPSSAVQEIFRQYAGFELTDEELQSLYHCKGYKNSPIPENERSEKEALASLYSSSLNGFIAKLITSKTCFNFTTNDHTGEDILLVAYHPANTLNVTRDLPSLILINSS